MKLLIIGNGFDKYCCLNSGFNDYFETKYSSLGNGHFFNNPNNVNVRHVNDYYEWRYDDVYNLTFIEKYIMYYKNNIKQSNLHWSDVEGIISEMLRSNGMLKNAYEKVLKSILLRDGENSHDPIDILARMIYKEFVIRYPEEGTEAFITYEELLRRIRLDLFQFENKFKEFLIKDLNNKKDLYNKNTKKLIEELIGPSDYKTLTFNYTSPSILNIKDTEYVHGSLNSDKIIMGVDSTKVDYMNPSYIFTKTYRKVEQYVNHDFKVVNDILNNEFTEIIFFGHSLNEQDYAYFQTIFDKQNLYDGNIRLKFYYYVYDVKQEEHIKEMQTRSVVKLIETYGTSLVNKSQGKNLLHNLLIHNRLKIKRIYKDLEDECE